MSCSDDLSVQSSSPLTLIPKSASLFGYLLTICFKIQREKIIPPTKFVEFLAV